MTAHDVRVATDSTGGADSGRRAVRPLDEAAILQLARRLVVFTPNGDQIAALMDLARRTIPMLTTAAIVQRAASHNPDCFWAIARRDRFDVACPRGEGYVAFLPLTEEGLRGLLDGTLDRQNPPLTVIPTQNQKPAGIYVWHVYAPGQLAAGVTLAAQKIWSLQNQDVDLYSWSINEEAARFVEGMGFRRAPMLTGSAAPQFHVFRRSKGVVREVPSPLDSPANLPTLSVEIARTIEDFIRAVSVRGAVYIGEQQCPYEEEFDGNDFSATHLIGYVGREPAGCMRIRYFAQFAKVERLVVRKEFRSSGLARHIVRAGIELCEMKGYEQVCVYAQKRLVKFWEKCGFHLPEDARELVFSDFHYVEMLCRAKRAPQAISPATDPYVIIRPEGAWHSPGILERSVTRGIRGPAAGEVAA